MRRSALFGVVTLPPAGLFALYEAAYCLWMCMHPLYAATIWQVKVGLWLLTAVGVGFLWVRSLLKLFR